MTDTSTNGAENAPKSPSENSKKRTREEEGTDSSSLPNTKKPRTNSTNNQDSAANTTTETPETTPSTSTEQQQQPDPYQKLVRNLRNIFRVRPHEIRYPSPEILSYVTPYNMAQTLIRWMNAMYFMHYQHPRGPPPAIYELVDLTACIGGNVLEFAQAYARVTCMELNQDSYDCLVHNIDLYRLRNIQARHANSMDWLFDSTKPKFGRDTGVFFDPPWGGREYNDRGSIPDLTMASSENRDYGVYDIVRRCFELDASMVCIKLPYNFDCDQFRQRGFKRSFVMRYNKCVYVIVFPKRRRGNQR